MKRLELALSRLTNSRAVSKFNVYQGVNHQYYFRLTSFDKLHVLKSDGYATEQLCHDAIALAKSNAPNISQYKKINSWLAYSFHLQSEIGIILFRSTNYTSGITRDLGIKIIQSELRNARVV